MLINVDIEATINGSREPVKTCHCEGDARGIRGAAIRARYSAKSAAEIGWQNLRKLQIAEAIAEAQKARSERTAITTRAPIRAGYSAKTARKIGSENLTKPDIAKAISEAQKTRFLRTRDAGYPPAHPGSGGPIDSRGPLVASVDPTV